MTEVSDSPYGVMSKNSYRERKRVQWLNLEAFGKNVVKALRNDEKMRSKQHRRSILRTIRSINSKLSGSLDGPSL